MSAIGRQVLFGRGPSFERLASHRCRGPFGRRVSLLRVVWVPLGVVGLSLGAVAAVGGWLVVVARCEAVVTLCHAVVISYRGNSP